ELSRVLFRSSPLIIQQNNITTWGGIHIGGNATATRILENEIEPTSPPAGSSFNATALIDVDGLIDASVTPAVPADSVLISGNSLQPLSAQGINQDGVRVNYANNTTIVNNRFGRVSGRQHVVVTSHATNTMTGTNVFLGGGGIALSGSGAGTISAIASSNGFFVGGSSSNPPKLDGNGSLLLATEAACLATGIGDRFVTWSAGLSQSCAQACAA